MNYYRRDVDESEQDSNAKVLVVDDNSYNMISIMNVLRKF